MELDELIYLGAAIIYSSIPDDLPIERKEKNDIALDNAMELWLQLCRQRGELGL